MKIQVLVQELNRFLEYRKCNESSVNGLQVKASNTITKVAGAVDATQETITKAAKKKCDLLIVHHGIKWRGEKSPVYNKRITLAKKLGVSIYAAHLPLDVHAQVGNAAVLLKLIGCGKTQPFGLYDGIYAGRRSTFEDKTSLSKILKMLQEKGLSEQKKFLFGKKYVKTIACVTGAGSSCLMEAFYKKIDLFITGETKYSTYNHAKELHMNVLALGHYHTEIFGVDALLAYIERKLFIPTTFIHGVAPQ